MRPPRTLGRITLDVVSLTFSSICLFAFWWYFGIDMQVQGQDLNDDERDFWQMINGLQQNFIFIPVLIVFAIVVSILQIVGILFFDQNRNWIGLLSLAALIWKLYIKEFDWIFIVSVLLFSVGPTRDLINFFTERKPVIRNPKLPIRNHQNPETDAAAMRSVYKLELPVVRQSLPVNFSPRSKHIPGGKIGEKHRTGFITPRKVSSHRRSERMDSVVEGEQMDVDMSPEVDPKFSQVENIREETKHRASKRQLSPAFPSGPRRRRSSVARKIEDIQDYFRQHGLGENFAELCDKFRNMTGSSTDITPLKESPSEVKEPYVIKPVLGLEPNLAPEIEIPAEKPAKPDGKLLKGLKLYVPMFFVVVVGVELCRNNLGFRERDFFQW